MTSPKTFHRFADLPGEVRSVIWKLAAQAQRDVVIVIQRRSLAVGGDFFFTSPTPVPAVLHASQESREETMLFFRRLGPGRPMNPTRSLHVEYLRITGHLPAPTPSDASLSRSKISAIGALQEATMGRQRILKKSAGNNRFFINPANDRYVCRLEPSHAVAAAANDDPTTTHPAIVSLCACVLGPGIRLRHVLVDLAGMGQTRHRRHLNVGLLVLNVLSSWALRGTELQRVEFCCSAYWDGDEGGDDVGEQQMKEEVESAIEYNMRKWVVLNIDALDGEARASPTGRRKLPVFSFLEMELELDQGELIPPHLRFSIPESEAPDRKWLGRIRSKTI